MRSMFWLILPTGLSLIDKLCGLHSGVKFEELKFNSGFLQLDQKKQFDEENLKSKLWWHRLLNVIDQTKFVVIFPIIDFSQNL